MDKSINPYDLGENNLVEGVETLKIHNFIKQAQKELKSALLASHIDALGIKVELCTTRTRFGGERLWFVCPACQKRAGNLYRGSDGILIGCRKCLNLKYHSQRT
jgi:hypothetical protein